MARRVYTGFDSAWTCKNRGAITSLIADDKTTTLVGPETASFDEALEHIRRVGHNVGSHVVAIDQPLIVPNQTGRRVVEAAVSHVVCRYRSAVQPANRGRREMFGDTAPLWAFLEALAGMGFCHEYRPHHRDTKGCKCFFEVYPALGNLGLFPAFYDRGVVPRYNPSRRTFKTTDWALLCSHTAMWLQGHGVQCMWLESAIATERPRKAQQDQLDSLICLCHAMHWGKGGDVIVVGDMNTGYMVVPSHDGLSTMLRDYAQQHDVQFWP